MLLTYLARFTLPGSQSYERHLLPSAECKKVTCCRHFCLKKKKQNFCNNSIDWGKKKKKRKTNFLMQK